MKACNTARRPSIQRTPRHTIWLVAACFAALSFLAIGPAVAESSDCRPSGACGQAHSALSALLNSSSEEIRLQAALGLLENACGPTGNLFGSEVEPGCLEPGNAQYASCKASCRKNSPDVPECFDGCVDVLGAVLARCPEARNFVAGNRGETRSAACYDCQRDCAEDYYQCNKDCQQADPWDPDCYDQCEDDCDSACSPPC